MKLCPRCNLKKTLSEFSINRRSKDGLNWDCRPCYKTYQAQGRARRNPNYRKREEFWVASDGRKKCTGCKQTKSVKQFEYRPGGHAGLRGRCKACARKQRNAYHVVWFQANKETVLAYERKYNASSPRISIRRALNNALRRCPTDNHPSLDELLQIFSKQSGKCALSGLLLTWASGKGFAQPTSISLDRIDQSRGYERGNVRFLANCINNFRGRMSDDEMRRILLALYDHQFGRKGAEAIAA